MLVIIILICAIAMIFSFGRTSDNINGPGSDLVIVASSQIGNVGGETYWR